LDLLSATFEKLLELFRTGRMVDLGTGHGKFAILAADRGWDVTAVDARVDRWPDDSRIAWVQEDVRQHVLTPYDLVVCLGLFYHLTCEDQLGLLSRAAETPYDNRHPPRSRGTSTHA
jgi:2-polyprenyl-3-methyl-5-hydroxy-6-metoxy-1,4-benzoquinol methylase